MKNKVARYINFPILFYRIRFKWTSFSPTNDGIIASMSFPD